MSEAMEQGSGAAALPSRGVGGILSEAFRLYRRHWRPLLAIAAVVAVPLTLLQYWLGDWVTSQLEFEQGLTGFWATLPIWLLNLLAVMVALLMYQVLTGAITRAVAAELAGEDLSVEQSYRFGFARLGSILLVSILAGLAIMGGLLLFVVPGIYIVVRLTVSIQALVVEGGRWSQALSRSWALVEGHWWHAFATLLAATFATLLAATLLTGVISAVITAAFSGGGSWLVQGLADAVATVLTLPYGALVGVLLYLDLRARKESLSLDTLRADLQASIA
jgi:hypothetical protein